MVEIGIFRRDLHEMELLNNGNEDQIGEYNWVYLADGREVVFDNSVATMGIMTLYTETGNEVKLFILRDWCNDFKPLSDF